MLAILRTRLGRRADARHTAARFAHPLQPEPRTAVLSAGFTGSKSIRVFLLGWDDEAARFQPESIAAPIEELRRLARDRVAGLHTLRHAVVALTFAGQPGLTGFERELFWRAWGVPIFEQYWSAPGGEMIAGECEAHQGLHIATTRANSKPNIHRPGYEIHPGACGCGVVAPRLVRLEYVEAPLEMAATAARLVS